jgi:hypothetical protein
VQTSALGVLSQRSTHGPVVTLSSAEIKKEKQLQRLSSDYYFNKRLYIYTLQIILATTKYRNDDGHILSEIFNLSNTTDIHKTEKCSGNVSVNK